MKLTQRTRQGERAMERVGYLGPHLWRIDWKRNGYPYCGVYVISPDNRWPCKIGISQNPSKRLLGIQTSCWRRVDIVGYRYAPNFNLAREVEKKVHQTLTLDSLLMYGEWFDIKPDKALEVIDFAAEMVGVELRKDIPPELVDKVSQFVTQMSNAEFIQMNTCLEDELRGL